MAATYALRITELLPEGAASIIDTDLDLVDVLPSVEFEEAMRAEAERAKAAQEALERAQAEAAAKALEAARLSAQAQAQAQERAKAAAEARAVRRAAAGAALPPVEPDAGAGVVAVQVRCPDGSKCTRRFLATDSAAALFTLVEASGWEECPEDFLLCAAYPRRVVRRSEAIAHGGRSLSDVGLNGRQEALFVELVTIGDASSAQEGRRREAKARLPPWRLRERAASAMATLSGPVISTLARCHTESGAGVGCYMIPGTLLQAAAGKLHSKGSDCQ